jgi:hypothetical protein
MIRTSSGLSRAHVGPFKLPGVSGGPPVVHIVFNSLGAAKAVGGLACGERTQQIRGRLLRSSKSMR